MIRSVVPVLVLVLLIIAPFQALADKRVHQNGLTICSIIINELTEGRVSLEKAKRISTAIGNAGNRHFGRVTCGDMWLYLAMVQVESGFRTNVVNYRNCRGMFQVHAPSWARKFGIKYNDLLDPQVNADAGIRVFKYYLERYGTLPMALSAYNCDNPRGARRYVRAVMGLRSRIKTRYTQLYQNLQRRETMTAEFDPLGTFPTH